MDISGKAARFIAEALQYRIEWYQAELERTDLSDDQRSDLSNDMHYMRALHASVTARTASPAARDS